MPITRRMTVAIAAVAATSGLLGCGQELAPILPSRTTVPSFTPPTEDGAPLAAFVYIRGDPSEAKRKIVVSLRGPDQSEALVFTFEAGERLAASDGALAGLYTVAIDDTECSGRINLLAGRETDAVLSIASEEVCRISAEGSHEASEAHGIAAVGGKLVGAIPPNAMIRVVSRDTPPAAVPEPQTPDEGGSFYFPSLMPGRYDIVLMSAETILDSETIELAPGEELTMELGPGTT